MKYSDIEIDWCGEILTKTCNRCNLEKSLDEFYKHQEGKFGRRPECKECVSKMPNRLLNKKRYQNTDRYKESTKAYNDSLYHKQSLAKYRNSPHGRAARCLEAANRRRLVRRATPKWLTVTHWEQIKVIYLQAALLNERDGKRTWHVDHIIPVGGKEVSGLHVPWNLQILEGPINLKKGNRV